MKTIFLTQGQVAIVDDDMFDYLNQWRWRCQKHNKTFYAVRLERLGKKQKAILMHRIILNVPDGFETDHRNHNGLDNRRENLRSCTHQQNGCNRQLQTHNGGFKGVGWHKKSKKWMARIGFNRQRIYLGLFNTAIEAAKAYDYKAKELFNEFALTNF